MVYFEASIHGRHANMSKAVSAMSISRTTHIFGDLKGKFVSAMSISRTTHTFGDLKGKFVQAHKQLLVSSKLTIS